MASPAGTPFPTKRNQTRPVPSPRRPRAPTGPGSSGPSPPAHPLSNGKRTNLLASPVVPFVSRIRFRPPAGAAVAVRRATGHRPGRTREAQRSARPRGRPAAVAVLIPLLAATPPLFLLPLLAQLLAL